MTTTHLNPEVTGIDVSQELQTLAPGISPVLAMYLQNGAKMAATQTKHEWFDDKILPKTFKVTSVSGQKITFNGGLPGVGYILSFKTPAGVHVGAKMRVTAVEGTNVATVQTLAGNISGVTPNSIAEVVSEGIPEGRKFERGTFHKWPREYNLTEIFDEGFEMSRTQASINGNANINTESVQANSALKRLAQKMTKAVIYGSRFEDGNIRAMAGTNYFLVEQTGANTLNVSGSVTHADFDKMVLSILEKSGEAGNLHIVCHGMHGNTIRGFNNRTLGIKDDAVGGAAKEYITSTGKVIPVVYDNNQPSNIIKFEDFDKIALIALTGGQARIGQARDDRDGIYRPITAEYTLEVRNAKDSHGAIIIS